MQPTGPSEPWAFTQEAPLTTRGFTDAAAERGIKINDLVLRELWRIGALEPVAEIRNRPVGPPQGPVTGEPTPTNSWTGGGCPGFG